MLSSVTELHSYIDRSQLTQELGGTQEYCHEKWISHRTVCSIDNITLLHTIIARRCIVQQQVMARLPF